MVEPNAEDCGYCSLSDGSFECYECASEHEDECTCDGHNCSDDVMEFHCSPDGLLTKSLPRAGFEDEEKGCSHFPGTSERIFQILQCVGHKRDMKAKNRTFESSGSKSLCED